MNEETLVVTSAGHPELQAALQEVSSEPWPEFMMHDAVSNSLWNRLYDVFPAFQFGLVDRRSGVLFAAANSIPLAWDGAAGSLPEDGWDWAIAQGFRDREQGRPACTLSALCISIRRDWQGRGMSRRVVSALRVIAAEHGLRRLIAPVRPNLKAQYPLIPIEEYVRWTRDDGSLFDAWMRVHAGLGAAVAGVCHRSMVITGSVGAWEQWTGLRFPGTGQYVVPGALVPVVIDRAKDTGTYVEPNVWMVHELNAAG